jgi:hypothetical protein
MVTAVGIRVKRSRKKEKGYRCRMLANAYSIIVSLSLTPVKEIDSVTPS